MAGSDIRAVGCCRQWLSLWAGVRSASAQPGPDASMINMADAYKHWMSSPGCAVRRLVSNQIKFLVIQRAMLLTSSTRMHHHPSIPTPTSTSTSSSSHQTTRLLAHLSALIIFLSFFVFLETRPIHGPAANSLLIDCPQNHWPVLSIRPWHSAPASERASVVCLSNIHPPDPASLHKKK